jgi:hypothetical protein
MPIRVSANHHAVHLLGISFSLSTHWEAGNVPATMNALPFDGRVAASGTLLTRVLHVTRLALAIHEAVALRRTGRAFPARGRFVGRSRHLFIVGRNWRLRLAASSKALGQTAGHNPSIRKPWPRIVAILPWVCTLLTEHRLAKTMLTEADATTLGALVSHAVVLADGATATRSALRFAHQAVRATLLRHALAYRNVQGVSTQTSGTPLILGYRGQGGPQWTLKASQRKSVI